MIKIINLMLFSILLSCLTSIRPIRIIIDSVDTKPIYNPYVWGKDTMNIYYNKIVKNKKVMHMSFIERKGLKKAGDTAIILKSWRKVQIIK